MTQSDIHKKSFVADFHCDTALQMLRGYDISKRHDNYHIDLPRLIDGGINLQIFAAFVYSEISPEQRFDKADRLLKNLISEFEKNNDVITLCRSYSEVQQAYSHGKISALLSIENGMALENKLDNLEYFYNLGVRSITLTHSKSHEWCSSSSDDQADKYGLTEFGKDVVREMNRLGMIIDVSHISVKAFFDVLKTTTAPVIASHSNAFALCPHDRNLNDEQLSALSENGGLVGVNFCADFLSESYWKKSKIFTDRYPDKLKKLTEIFISQKKEEEYQKEFEKHKDFINDWEAAAKDDHPDLNRVADHLLYLTEIAGVDHVGLGSDFDGINPAPLNLEDCSKFPFLTKELTNRGLKETDIEKILGLNFLRILKEIC